MCFCGRVTVVGTWGSHSAVQNAPQACPQRPSRLGTGASSLTISLAGRQLSQGCGEGGTQGVPVHTLSRGTPGRGPEGQVQRWARGRGLQQCPPAPPPLLGASLPPPAGLRLSLWLPPYPLQHCLPSPPPPPPPEGLEVRVGVLLDLHSSSRMFCPGSALGPSDSAFRALVIYRPQVTPRSGKNFTPGFTVTSCPVSSHPLAS